MNAIRDLIYS
ncbi:conserved hypothetical protein, partial [Trichinella spiralis]